MISLAYGALWIFVFSVPWENVLPVPGLGMISRLTGMIALGLALLAALFSGRFRRWHVFHVAALLFVIWAGSSVLLFDLGQVPRKFWTYVQLFLVLWMMWEIAPSRARLNGLLAAYVFGAYVSAISTIMASRREMGIARRFTAQGFDANDLAGALALALPMAWYLSTVSRRPLLRWACRAYLPVGLLAIGLTGSRGGMIATMVALLVVPLTMTRLSPGRLATAIAMLCLSGVLAVAYVPETIVQRLATTRSDVEEGHLGGRLKIWVAGGKAFAQRPLLGYGTSGFKTAIAPYLPTTPQVAHNSYLSVLVENGIVGFLFFAVMLLSVFRAVLHLPLLDRRFALVLLATLAVIMLPLAWEDHKAAWFILAALVGLARTWDAAAGSASHRQSSRMRGMPVASTSPRPGPSQPLAALRRDAERGIRP
jgi:O-antigen ligase